MLWCLSFFPVIILVMFSFFMLQFNFMKDQGTRIVMYNLWEDDEGKLEMDFDSDPHVCH